MNKCEHLTGRDWIEKGYLPQLAGRVLWVGVAERTKHYHTLVQEPEKFETIDVAPMREKWGAPNNHHVGDFLEFETIREYDHIGLYGLDPMYTPKNEPNWLVWSVKMIEWTLHLLKPGGTLLFGGYTAKRTGEIFLAVQDCEKLFVREVNINGRNCLKLWVRKKKS